ncbi:hypothetical protein PGT21_006682 [Puccinia graminis f. sp. tritici]|uniref:Uncharacterized protein n=1 Tax=Puccinia graminis f. sp. tritici TaxID=56615 RepID=A0A5B0R456_PUCGR|nr:hypothetical protein PGT21_006682 [Puccinia graminis f. sp. tritici]KAA1120471.1 hypothetical protein PGTUg99_001004 [Puccinia graminis f. sp. tritici]
MVASQKPSTEPNICWSGRNDFGRDNHVSDHIAEDHRLDLSTSFVFVSIYVAGLPVFPSPMQDIEQVNFA